MSTLRGLGWWYDRDNQRYRAIYDHTLDVISRPEEFRVTRDEVAACQGPDFEDVREKVIPLVCSRHWIRIRWVPRRGDLGWQFTGEPPSALEVLKAFAAERGVGDGTNVQFTDFAFGDLLLPLGELLRGAAAADYLARWERSRGITHAHV